MTHEGAQTFTIILNSAAIIVLGLSLLAGRKR